MESQDADGIVREHLVVTARLLDQALREVRGQAGAEVYAAVAAALYGGGAARATTTISPGGAMAVVFDLVSPGGAVVNIGTVEFDAPAQTMN